MTVLGCINLNWTSPELGRGLMCVFSILACTVDVTENIPHIFGEYVQCLSSQSPLCCDCLHDFLACVPHSAVQPSGDFFSHYFQVLGRIDERQHAITFLVCVLHYTSYLPMTLAPTVGIC